MAKNLVGVNLNGPISYSTGPMFLNCLKQCASNTIYCPWFTGSSSSFDTGEQPYLTPTLDAHGNPTTLTVAGIPGGQQFTKLFTYVHMNMGSVPAGASLNYTAGAYTFVGKIGGNGSAASIQFAFTNDVTGLASQTTGVTVAGTTVTSTLAPGSTFTLTFASAGSGGFVITLPAGSGISAACYFDFASGYIVPTAYLADYLAGKVLHPEMKMEIVGDGSFTGYNAPLRWMTLQRTFQQEWQIAFSANLAQNAAAGTMTTLTRQGTSTTSWPWPTGTKPFIFANGQVINVSGTHGQADVTFDTELAAAVATNAVGAMAIATEQSGWANRPKLGDLSWAGPLGVPLEAAIQACNEVGRDAWLCVPASANLVDSGWYNSFAELLFNGTGAVLSGSNLTTFGGLSAAQKAYVEFSNETWNYGSNYKEANLCSIGGVVEGFYAAQGNSQFLGAQEWHGMQTALIGEAFSTVYGAARSSRVAVVCMNQFAIGNGTAFINIAMNTPDWASGPAWEHIDAKGFAPYAPSLDGYSTTDAANLLALGGPAAVNKVFAHMWAPDASFPSVPTGGWIGSKLTTAQTLIGNYGGQPWASLPTVGYEAGPATDDATNIETTVPGWRVSVLDAVKTDSRMAQVMYDPDHVLSSNDGYLPGLQAAGFSFVCHLSDISKLMAATDPPGSGNWGAAQSYMQTLNPTSAPPTLQGILGFINAQTTSTMTQPSVLQQKSANGASASLSLGQTFQQAFALGAPVTTGNALGIVLVVVGPSVTIQSIVDDKGNTYTPGALYHFTQGGNWYLSAALTPNITNAPSTLTVTALAGATGNIKIEGTAYELAGLGTAPVLDVAEGLVTNFGTGAATLSFTTTSADEMALMVLANSGPSAITLGSPWTQDTANTTGWDTAHQVIAAVGAQSIPLTRPQNEFAAAYVVTWAPTAAGVTITVPAHLIPALHQFFSLLPG